MSKFGFAVPAIAVAFLAACASEQPATPAPAPVVIMPQQAPAPVVTAPSAPTAVVVAPPVSIKPGYGRVETIAALPATSGAGTTAASEIRRLGVRMEDGTFQYVDAPIGSIKVGDRVQFTPEGYIRHPV